MITKDQSIARLQRRLDDAEEGVWTKARLGEYLQDGYDRLCRGAKAIFDMQMHDTQPLTSNHTKDYEADFMESPVLGRFTVTRPSDAEFVDGNPIVANHTRRSDAEFMSSADPIVPMIPTTRTLFRLPAGYVEVDRVTHDWLRLEPDHDRYHRKTRQEYQTLEGGVFSYQMDQDGWQNIRLVSVPVRVVSTEEINGIYGVIRQLTTDNLGDEPIIGSYGGLRSVPRHFCSGQYGVVRRVVSDNDATRVELYRLGKNLDQYPFEIPDRSVKYVEYWAMHRAYSQPGEGENKKMADHYKARFEAGVETLKQRVKTIMRERTIAMGSKRETSIDPYLAHFPVDMGYGRPFRRGGR